MTKKILATALAASLALTSFTAPAVAKPSEGVRILQGLAALYIISRVIKDNKRATPAAVAPTLPNRCLRVFQTDRGQRRGYGVRCMSRNAPQISLPQQCKRRINTEYGRRNFYGAKCLRDHGFDVARR